MVYSLLAGRSAEEVALLDTSTLPKGEDEMCEMRKDQVKILQEVLADRRNFDTEAYLFVVQALETDMPFRFLRTRFERLMVLERRLRRKIEFVENEELQDKLLSDIVSGIELASCRLKLMHLMSRI